MLNEEKINEIYDKVIEENKQDIEREKKQAKIWNIIKYIMMMVSIVAVYKITQLPIVYEKYSSFMEWISSFGFFGVCIYILFPYVLFVIFCILVVVALIYDILNIKYYNYIHNFNNRMINRITEMYNERFKYLPIEGINEKIYIEEAEFEKFDKYKSSDLIKGTLANKCKLEIAQIIAHYLAPNLYGMRGRRRIICSELKYLAVLMDY